MDKLLAPTRSSAIGLRQNRRHSLEATLTDTRAARRRISNERARSACRISELAAESLARVAKRDTRKLTCGDPETFKRARRPKIHLLRTRKVHRMCGGYVVYWRERLPCFNARSRDPGTNRRT